MNLKFMDFEFGANLHNGVFFGLLHWRPCNEKSMFDQTFSGWDWKSQDTWHSSKEYDHRIDQTATKPSQTLRTNYWNKDSYQ